MTVIVLGGINEDVVLSVDNLPRLGETIHALGIVHGAGGKGLNQAIGAARQGGAVRMLGAVGDDAPGATLMGIMAREGIDTTDVAIVSDQSTGQAFITLSRSGDNTILVNAGANAAYGSAAIATARTDARIFLTQFEATPEAIEALFTTAAAKKGIRILNAAPAIKACRPLLSLADILIVNETELQVFADLPTVPERLDDIAAAARSLVSRSDQQVIVTLGANGCLCVAIDTQEMIAGFTMKAIDTIGAGDCFCGVLAASLDEGMGIGAALRRANAAAALSVTRAGAGESAPTRAEVDALLAHSLPSQPEKDRSNVQ
jgi:ribokinase